METTSQGLVDTVMGLPLFHAEWVMWLLIALSVVSIAVMIERGVFYLRHAVDVDAIRARLVVLLKRGDFAGAAAYLQEFDSLETNVVLFGLRDSDLGPDAVEDLIAGAMSRERQRYERRLTFLATIGNNAPFIGLFGTVLGIIRAFKDLAGDMSNASDLVMAGISEALVATAIGLLVAIPAVVAYNVFKGRIKSQIGNTELLARILMSQLKGHAQSHVGVSEIA